MRIRRVRPDEHRLVGEITAASYADFLLEDDPYRPRLTDVATRDAEAEVWVAVDEGDRPVGSVTVCPPGSSWREVSTGPEQGEFRMLSVDPRVQGQGVGECLTRAVVERFRAEGATSVALCSLPVMTAAHRLYGRVGFERREQLDWSPMPGVDLIGFVKELT